MGTNQTNAVANRQTNIMTAVQGLMEKYKGQIAMALPRHMTVERMIRVALTALSQSPLLQKCEPITICGAVVQCSILGLEPNSTLGEAFLIPYWNSKAKDGKGGYECQMQVGYKGVIKLARNSGEIGMVDAQPVHENDDFEFEKGDQPRLTHKWGKTGNRGPIIGYWAGFKTKDHVFNFEYWPLDQILEHRDLYSQGAYKKDRGQLVKDKDGNKILQGPWRDSPDWMCRKTVLIQVLKLAPKSVQAQSAIALDEVSEAGMRQAFTVDVPLELHPAAQDDSSDGGYQEPKRKEEPKPEAKTEEKPEELKVYAPDALPDAMQVIPGYRCIVDNGKERKILECVEPEGEASSWKLIGLAPMPEKKKGKDAQ